MKQYKEKIRRKADFIFSSVVLSWRYTFVLLFPASFVYYE